MILCVDIGNTATKLAIVEAEGVVAASRLPTGDAEPVVRAALEMLGSGVLPDGVGISSVVPDATEATRAALSRLGRPVVVVSHQSTLPFRLAVPQPERVGSDRLCAVAGAVGSGAVDAVVVDIGTAITVDRVCDLEFVGGAIMPGPDMMLRAMGTFARQLPPVALEDVETLFPNTAAPTENAMALGAGVATLGGIFEAVGRLSGGDEGIPVWVTGGASDRYVGHLPEGWRTDLDLSARGLFRITRLSLESSA